MTTRDYKVKLLPEMQLPRPAAVNRRFLTSIQSMEYVSPLE